MLQAMIIVFGFMFLGYASQYKDENNRSLSKLCLYFLIPILIFQSIIHSSVSIGALSSIILHFFITTLLVYGLLMTVVGRIMGWQGPLLKWNSLSSTLANVGYFGLAVIQFGIGSEAVPYAIAVALAFNLYMAIFGFAQVNQSMNWKNRIQSVFRNPYLYAVVAGLFWRWAGLKLPEEIDHLLRLIVQTTLPITLLLTGAELRGSSFNLTHFKEAIQISIIKLILPVLLAFPVTYLFSVNSIERNVMILMFGMPTSLNLLILAKEHGRDTSIISLAILMTTLLSPATLLVLIRILSIV